MGSLFQAIGQTAGAAGSGYADARDAAIQQANDAKVKSFEMAMQLQQQLRQSQVDAANQALKERQLKAQEAGNILDLGVSQTPDGKWVHTLHNLGTSKTVAIPMEGPPAAYVTAEENKKAALEQANELEDRREADRQKDIASRGEWEERTARLRAQLGLGGPDDFAFVAPYVSNGAIKLATVSTKSRPALLKYMAQNGYKLPNQLSDAVNDKLTQRLDSLTSFDKLLTDMSAKGPDGKSELDLLNDTRNQIVIQTIRSAKDGSYTALAALKLIPQATVDRLSKVAADLDSAREMVNLIRSPLGAGGFRGKEGWEGLQGTIPQPFGPVGVNMNVLKRTQDLVRRLEQGTEVVLDGGDFGPSAVTNTVNSQLNPQSKPKFVRDPRTGEMVEQ